VLIDHLSWPLTVAHRGARSTAPENTLEAVAAAIDAGSDLIEVDVHLAADGSLVLCHDTTLNRTHGVALPVAGLTATAVKRWPVRSASRLGLTGWPDVPTVTLNEVFARFARAPVAWLIEAKYPSAPTGARLDAVGDAIVDHVFRWNLAGSVIVQSFQRRPGLRAVAAGLPAGYIETAGGSDPRELADQGFDYYGMRKDAPPDRIAAAADAGLRPLLYTINRRSERDAALAAGAAGIVTDDPLYLAGRAPGPDLYALGTWPHGHLPSPVNPVTGVLTGSALELAPARMEAGAPGNYTAAVLGSLSHEAPPESWTWDVRVALLEAASATRSAQVQFCMGSDVGYHDDDHGRVDCYNVLLRPNGTLDLYAAADGAGTRIATATGPAVPVSATDPVYVPLRIEVSPTHVGVSRLDASGVVAAAADPRFRGGYVGVGVRSVRARFVPGARA
jgi:glycerophosphoryl diester phosphodiesterase